MSINDISACVMTRNEERNLPGLLENLKGHVREIIAVDESDDGSRRILLGYGAKIIEVPKAKRGLPAIEEKRHLFYRHVTSEWILYIDADERLSDELKSALPSLTRQKDYDVIWVYSRHHYAQGKYFRHGFHAPHREPRLYRKSCKVRYDTKIHEMPRLDGRGLETDYYYDHLTYTEPKGARAKKHERYILVERKHKEKYLSKNPLARSFFVSFGYLVFLLYGMFIKLAFLDGMEGVTANSFMAQYYADSGYLEVYLKRKLGLINYSPFID